MALQLNRRSKRGMGEKAATVRISEVTDTKRSYIFTDDEIDIKPYVESVAMASLQESDIMGPDVQPEIVQPEIVEVELTEPEIEPIELIHPEIEPIELIEPIKQEELIHPIEEEELIEPIEEEELVEPIEPEPIEPETPTLPVSDETLMAEIDKHRVFADMSTYVNYIRWTQQGHYELRYKDIVIYNSETDKSMVLFEPDYIRIGSRKYPYYYTRIFCK